MLKQDINLFERSFTTHSRSDNFKKPKFLIPETVHLIDSDCLAKLVNENILILDVRPFIEFNKNHLANSINFNLPSTLLKRSNFNLNKCLNNLSINDSIKLSEFLELDQSIKKIIIYDDLPILNNEISLGAFGALNKFIESSYNLKLFILQNGFQSFFLKYPQLTQSETPSNNFKAFSYTKNISVPNNLPNNLPNNTRSLSLANFSTPNLSRFQLPNNNNNNLPFFKIRHNEENFDFNNKFTILNEFNYLKDLKNDNIKLPEWLRNLSVDQLIDGFKLLEVQEKNRINEMINTNSIGFGIELGSKNRYKDIFPYEHSRVKLLPSPNNENPYINANFISYLNFQYIATQAPLLSTLTEFNKLINDNDINILISLTNQFENGIEKCYPYWNDSNYFNIIEESKISNIVIRRLKLNSSKEVIQFQLLNWFDYDIILQDQQSDILKLIYFKKSLINNLKNNGNVLVHCSAGCGRTGTFCTLDTILNYLNFNKNFDLIFNIVETFRNQRISMVQNLRQYLFIYDCLINYFENFTDSIKFNNDFKNLAILNNFIRSKLNE